MIKIYMYLANFSALSMGVEEGGGGGMELQGKIDCIAQRSYELMVGVV